jgi:hypothetical protein
VCDLETSRIGAPYIYNVRLLRVKNWIACVQDRGKWKEVVEKTKTFN